jgi:hypothetical protein
MMLCREFVNNVQNQMLNSGVSGMSFPNLSPALARDTTNNNDADFELVRLDG